MLLKDQDGRLSVEEYQQLLPMVALIEEVKRQREKQPSQQLLVLQSFRCPYVACFGNRSWAIKNFSKRTGPSRCSSTAAELSKRSPPFRQNVDHFARLPCASAIWRNFLTGQARFGETSTEVGPEWQNYKVFCGSTLLPVETQSFSETSPNFAEV